MILRIGHGRHIDGLQVTYALRRFGKLNHLFSDRKEQGGKQDHDGHDDKDFNHGEAGNLNARNHAHECRGFHGIAFRGKNGHRARIVNSQTCMSRYEFWSDLKELRL